MGAGTTLIQDRGRTVPGNGVRERQLLTAQQPLHRAPSKPGDAQRQRNGRFTVAYHITKWRQHLAGASGHLSPGWKRFALQDRKAIVSKTNLIYTATIGGPSSGQTLVLRGDSFRAI